MQGDWEEKTRCGTRDSMHLFVQRIGKGYQSIGYTIEIQMTGKLTF